MKNETGLKKAVILAGGMSQRMGFAKGLLQKDGISLVRIHLQNLRDLGLDTRVVVGLQKEAYLSVLDLDEIIENPYSQFGPFSSIQCAANYFTGEPLLIQPVDQLPLCKDSLQILVGGFEKRFDVMDSCEQKSHKNGHPIILGACFLRELLELGPENRLDEQIKNRSEMKIKKIFIADPAIITNLNCLEDALRFSFYPPDNI